MHAKPPGEKERLDRLLVHQGLAASREAAVRTIMAGGVLVDGAVVDKPARLVARSARIEIEHAAPFVSRAGEKLAAALEAFSIDTHGLVALDVGCSTGGVGLSVCSAGAEKNADGRRSHPVQSGGRHHETLNQIGFVGIGSIWFFAANSLVGPPGQCCNFFFRYRCHGFYGIGDSAGLSWQIRN